LSEVPARGGCRAIAIVPSFNNEAAVAQVVRDVLAHGLEVVVINDGSTDGTAAAAQEAGATVVDHPVNQGKGAALLTGFDHAAGGGFTHVVTIDADGQHFASDLPRLLARMQARPHAIVVGSRPRDTVNVPRSSKIGRAISDVMLWASSADELAGERPDSQCGYRIYPLSHVLALRLRARRYDFEQEILVRAAWHRVPVVAEPIDVHYPPAEERVSHFHKWRDNGRIVRVYTRLMLMRLFWPVFRPRKRLAPPDA
jgi:glycosyltransferase involved in cell wall biosynthesis